MCWTPSHRHKEKCFIIAKQEESIVRATGAGLFKSFWQWQMVKEIKGRYESHVQHIYSHKGEWFLEGEIEIL